ncbi:MAG: sigma-54 dependent transcriptional regulator [Thermodesulfobacteriota bacterium]
MKRVLVASPDERDAAVVAEALEPEDRVEAVSAEVDLRRRLGPDLDFVMLDIAHLGPAPGRRREDYRRELRRLWEASPAAEIIVLAPQERLREAVDIVRAGAGNYLTYPLAKVEVRYVLESLIESQKVQSELDYFRDESALGEVKHFAPPVSKAMRVAHEKALMVAPTKSTVLLKGETGTGKGVLAGLIHANSNRSGGPFISVHCGAIPENLVESELFGHEKGAFTGAVRRQLGKFELAAGGTIFLDEIGTVSPAVQIKLLQVLQDRVFHRVGGEKDIPMEARIIAASNVDLKELCDRGAFRTDLYYRLNVFPIDIPPLRERREDIPTLAESFLERLAAYHNKTVHGLHPRVLEAFASYDWPGNVRELENLIERAFILETSHLLTPGVFPPEVFPSPEAGACPPLDFSRPLADVRQQAADAAERAYLEGVLALRSGRVGQAADQAGITSRQLRNLMAKHGLRKEDYRRERPEK